MNLYAWVAEDGLGQEGIIVVPSKLGMLPLVGQDFREMSRLKLDAARAMEARAKSARLVRFEQVAVLDEVQP